MLMTTSADGNNTRKPSLLARKSKFEGMLDNYKCYMWLAPENFSAMYEVKLKELHDLSMRNNYFIVANESELKQVQKIIQYPHPTKEKWGIRLGIDTQAKLNKFQSILLSKTFNWEFCVVFITVSNYRLYMQLNKLTSVLIKHKLNYYTMSFSFLNKDDIEPLVGVFFKGIEKPALLHLLSIRNNAELVYDCLRACSDSEVLTLDIVRPFRDTSAYFNKYIGVLVEGKLVLTKRRVSDFLKETNKLKLEYGFRSFSTRIKRQMADIMNVKQLEVQGNISRHLSFNLDKIKEDARFKNITKYRMTLCLNWSEKVTLREIVQIYSLLLLANSEEKFVSTLYKIATRSGCVVSKSKVAVK